MFRELRNIIKNELVRIAWLVEVLLVVVWLDATHDLGHCIVKLGVSTEFLPFLSVLVLVCHGIITS